MFEAFRIRPVVESMDESGEVTCEAFASLADAERDCAQFEACRSASERKGKTIIWTLYGVNAEENEVRTEDAIADRDTEGSACELLTSIIGPFTTDDAGYSTPAALPTGAAALLSSALGHIETYKDTEDVDSSPLPKTLSSLRSTPSCSPGRPRPTAPWQARRAPRPLPQTRSPTGFA